MAPPGPDHLSMRRRLLGSIVAAVVVAALFAAPAGAKAPVQRRGLCEVAPTHWILNVQKGAVLGTLRIRFVVRGAIPGVKWQVLLSDGRGLPAVDRFVGLDGSFRMTRVIHNRPGHDHILDFATQTKDEVNTCSAGVTF